MKKKQLLGSGCAAVLVFLLIGIWNIWIRSTEVINEELDKLTSYDMVFINVMCRRIT